MNYRRGYALETILNSEETYYLKVTMVLKKTLDFEGTGKKDEEENITRSRKLKGEERKSFGQFNRTIW